MTDRSKDGSKPVRQAAAVLGGFITGFVLGDGGLASNSVGVIGLAVWSFSLVR